MPFQEKNISHFPIIFGRNLLSDVAGFVMPKVLVVTMEDLWPLFKNELPNEVEVYLVSSLERRYLESELPKFEHLSSVVGLG